MSTLVMERPPLDEFEISDVLPKVFNVIVRPCTDTVGYYAICDTPNGGCVTQAKTLQEVQKNMIEAMEFHFEDYPYELNYYLSFEVHHATDTGN